MLQSVELRDRLNAAIVRISSLENDRDNMYQMADKKIEKEAIARDVLIRKTIDKQERAQLESMKAKVEAAKLAERVTKLESDLKSREKQITGLTHERNELLQKSLKLEKRVENLKRRFSLKNTNPMTNQASGS